ncbi:unnamed protein product [Thelazia callipaeda]|uniref:26S proteasome non-ATPase regulatory subunit 5 n=1 Tax=Thelazia callipaeda TaxID=103827 RepID=A0A0N5CRN8_THECL|nr:unnamed protein product [Thelazia callipaeda]
MRDSCAKSDEKSSMNNPLRMAEKFRAMKESIVAERTEIKAMEILQELFSYHTTSVDWNVFPEFKGLLICILDTVGIVSLTEKHQILILNAVNKSDAKVIGVLADYYIQHIDEVHDMLAKSHVAITIAFSRRIIDFDCAGTVAILLRRFAGSKLVQAELLNNLDSNPAEIRFRIHQVTTLLMKEGDNLHNVEGLVAKLADELGSSDVLTQINAVEMFADGASNKKSTAHYLLSTGIVDHLHSLFVACMDHPDSGFLYPALVKFFGHLLVTNAECMPQFPKFLDSLFDLVYHFDRLDASLRLLSFDTLAAIGSTDSAKKFLNSHHSSQHDMQRAMTAFGVAIASGPLDLRVRHMDALSMMFAVKDQDTDENKTQGSATKRRVIFLFQKKVFNLKDTEVEQITHKWFNWLGEPFPIIITSYMSKPFYDTRISALRLLSIFFDYPWAIRIFSRTTGFMKCLLNRSIETNADGKQCRFDVICKIITGGSTIISPEDMLRLKLYRREGAFYVERQPEVDIEND